ncbi:Uncharacterized protein OBRU01_21101 [Operophtera brumata]|uniref:Uncharacterized protein n=1 Tax=Operophtera brumata TaxID=104452 RepID=A0A0L7KTD6_OPEBR|nr:Uncharacterized protein OBRU01_21101 [Operophtera brumata]
MKVRRAHFVFLYALAATAHALVDDVIDVLKLSKDIGEEVLSSWDILAKPFNVSSGVALPIVRRREREVLARLEVVTRAIKRVELNVKKAGAVAMFLAKNSGRGTRVELRLHELSDLLGRVASADRVMREYVGIQEELEQSTLENFAEWCVSHEPAALPGLMERVHALIIPPHKQLLGRGLLQMLLEDLQVSALFALFALGLAKDLNPVDNLRENFYNLENGLWKNVTDPAWRDNGLGGDVELTKAFVGINDQIVSLPSVTRPTFTSWLWIRVTEKLQVIDGLYENFMEFVTRQATPGGVPAPVREWLDLAEAILMDPKSSVTLAVRQFHELMEHGDLFRTALQLIYDMYNTIALTEIKGYAMMQFSWMLLRIYGKGNYTQEASLTRQRYSERTGQAAAAARAALSLASRDLYRCDPSVHEEGVTYDQVTRLLQGYIENEVDMNPEGTCRENCEFYSLAKRHGCYKDQCVQQKRCDGRIINCKYVDSDMWVCPASASSGRRYDWIEFENGRTMGKVGSCRRGTTKVDSWWRWLFWHCSFCMCLCDDTANSDRYFSLWDATSDVDSWWRFLSHCTYCICLCEEDGSKSERFFSMRQAEADIEKGKVVTGVRLVKFGKVFHLQIHQGELRERGSVAPGEWLPLQKFDPSDMGVVDGVDYHTLTYERKAIDLDELESPSGHVMTGVRFRMIGAHLHFEIRSTPFNYTTGRLSPEKSQWVSNDNTEGALESPRKRLELFMPDIPTRGHTPFPVDSNHDQYIEFTHTDFDADAAQSTVPFVDIQPVVPSKGGALLSGAGIIHRGSRGSGGFIAVKLLTYDFSKHVKAEPLPADITEPDATEFTPMIN